MTARIELEPPRFGMSGPASYCGMRYDCPLSLVQALDAPQYIARGSVEARFESAPGVMYASTTDLNWDRVRPRDTA